MRTLARSNSKLVMRLGFCTSLTGRGFPPRCSVRLLVPSSSLEVPTFHQGCKWTRGLEDEARHLKTAPRVAVTKKKAWQALDISGQLRPYDISSQCRHLATPWFGRHGLSLLRVSLQSEPKVARSNKTMLTLKDSLRDVASRGNARVAA